MPRIQLGDTGETQGRKAQLLLLKILQFTVQIEYVIEMIPEVIMDARERNS